MDCSDCSEEQKSDFKKYLDISQASLLSFRTLLRFLTKKNMLATQVLASLTPVNDILHEVFFFCSFWCIIIIIIIILIKGRGTGDGCGMGEGS